MNPDLTHCEVFVERNEYCFGEDNMVCVNWRKILAAIFICNFLQIIFEAAMLHALEVTLKPTNLDKLQNPDLL